MKTIKVHDDDPSERQLKEICRDLREGCIMIWPTDTTYALACDALNPKAIERICRLKGINPDKTNLSIVCTGISQAAEYARIDNSCYRLMRDNTPGAFTFLLHSSSSLPKVFKGRKVVGIRIPDNRTCQKIVEQLGNPVMTASIEYEDEDYGTNPDLMAEAYDGKVDFLIDGGIGDLEVSTVVECTGDEPLIVREGKGILSGE